MNATLTSIPGIEVGHWTDPVAMTGCTVVVLPEPNVVAGEFRGAAPGSRETALLSPGMSVETAHAIVLTGGSAFGLAAADGVVAALESDGRGHPALAGPVPIVPAAVVYDLLTGDPAVRPGPAEGRLAYEVASGEPVVGGSVGAGTGTLVSGWRGAEAIRRGGLGNARVVGAGFNVAALAVVNAVGDVFSLEGEALTGGQLVPSGPANAPRPLQQTTLVVVATDAQLDRPRLGRLAVRAHDALAVCVRPAHTAHDGDAVFAVSAGSIEVDPLLVAEAAWEATGRAIESAIRLASVAPGMPS